MFSMRGDKEELVGYCWWGSCSMRSPVEINQEAADSGTRMDGPEMHKVRETSNKGMEDNSMSTFENATARWKEEIEARLATLRAAAADFNSILPKDARTKVVVIGEAAHVMVSCHSDVLAELKQIGIKGWE